MAIRDLMIFLSFLSELQSLSGLITTATLELYNRIVRDLPPTPSKFHYIFNLRDLSRVYHGLSLSTPDRFDSLEKLIRLWRNECFRVFFDRLTNDKDRDLVSVSSLQLTGWQCVREKTSFSSPFSRLRITSKNCYRSTFRIRRSLH